MAAIYGGRHFVGGEAILGCGHCSHWGGVVLAAILRCDRRHLGGGAMATIFVGVAMAAIFGGATMATIYGWRHFVSTAMAAILWV